MVKTEVFNKINSIKDNLIDLLEDGFDLGYLFKFLNHILHGYMSSNYIPLVCDDCIKTECTNNCIYYEYTIENEIEDYINETLQ
jgi:hypothetical protein